MTVQRVGRIKHLFSGHVISAAICDRGTFSPAYHDGGGGLKEKKRRKEPPMQYEGPIYRPPSEAGSLLIQATVGCPHNRCTFCMVYKNGPRYRVRPLEEIEADIDEAAGTGGGRIETLFFPAGNTIAMKTDDLCRICRHAKRRLPKLRRITVYGSSQYVHRKGPEGLRRLAEAGLSRIHVGLESGDDETLRRIRKGCDSRTQIEAGIWVRKAGIELSLYVILGIAGIERTRRHAERTAAAINLIRPHFVRLRTFVPKVGTPLLEDLRQGRFSMIGPHGVLREAARLIEGIDVPTTLASDHYTNYVDLSGALPGDRKRLLGEIEKHLKREEDRFRPFFIGTQ
jgi:radical SAM superfamily enzyme YgiQ (UPF0313 family)